jgi:hypothetical protein
MPRVNPREHNWQRVAASGSSSSTVPGWFEPSPYCGRNEHDRSAVNWRSTRRRRKACSRKSRHPRVAGSASARGHSRCRGSVAGGTGGRRSILQKTNVRADRTRDPIILFSVLALTATRRCYPRPEQASIRRGGCAPGTIEDAGAGGCCDLLVSDVASSLLPRLHTPHRINFDLFICTV